MQLLDSSARLIDNIDGLAISYEQAITSDLLDGLADDRIASSQMRAGEHHKLAEIPVTLVDLWARQGFDVFRESGRAIVQRLRREGLDAFIATSKAV